MKKMYSLSLCLLITLVTGAQMSIRVKNAGNSKELEVKTTRSTSKEKGTDSKPLPGEAKTQQPSGETSGNSGQPKIDTVTRPEIENGDATYNGPAKSMVETFYRQAGEARNAIENGKKYGQFQSAEGKVRIMETTLKKIKEKDPGYSNIARLAEIHSGLRKEVEAANNEAAGKIASGRKEAADKTINEKLLETVIDGTNMEVGSNNLPYMDQAMTDFKANAENMLKLDLSKYKEKLADLKMYVDKSHTLAADRVMGKAQTVIKELSDAGNFAPILKELQFRQLYWDVIRKVYTGDAICEKYYTSISALLKQLGSSDDIKNTAAKNNAEKIKETKIPAAAVRDAAFEKALLDGFNNKYKATFKGTAMKVVILAADWYIERNDVTGIVTGRNKVCALAYKGDDGKCYLLDGSIYAYQDFIGGNFAKTQVIYRGFGSQEMLCENVK